MKQENQASRANRIRSQTTTTKNKKNHTKMMKMKKNQSLKYCLPLRTTQELTCIRLLQKQTIKACITTRAYGKTS